MVTGRLVVDPGLVKVFSWNFPPMSARDRATALGFKVKAAVPLAPEKYTYYPVWFVRNQGLKVVVAVVRTEEGKAFYQAYRSRKLWFTQDQVPGKPLVQAGKTYRKGFPPVVLGALAALALVLAAGAAFRVSADKARQLADWGRWAGTLVRTPAADRDPAEAKLRLLAGFPLGRTLEGLAKAWGPEVRLLSLVTKGRHVTLEARGSSASRALAGLSTNRALGTFHLVRTQTVGDGQDQFLIEGDVTIDP